MARVACTLVADMAVLRSTVLSGGVGSGTGLGGDVRQVGICKLKVLHMQCG